MHRPGYDDLQPVVTNVDGDDVTVTFHHLLDEAFDDAYVTPLDLEDECEAAGVKRYSYDADALRFEPQH